MKLLVFNHFRYGALQGREQFHQALDQPWRRGGRNRCPRRLSGVLRYHRQDIVIIIVVLGDQEDARVEEEILR